MSGVFRMAVLSDLHFASSEDARKDSHVILSRSDVISKQHPANDLKQLIADAGLKSDVVLCPGDITLQADTIALRAAWSSLNEIRTELGASHLFAATGNHDIASRLPPATDNSRGKLKTSPEIWEALKQLSPSYPYPQATDLQRLHYWAEHFLVAEVGDVRFVVLNTCNSHSRGESEYLHGRITDYTLSVLESQLKKDGKRPLNVLLCHHHPMKQPELNQTELEYSEMKQGRKLLDSLEQSEQPWFVIHGHKHNPKLEYAQGSSGNVPIVFSAGSFSAVLSPAYFPMGKNQFYIIEFDMQYVSNNGLAGIVRAWNWAEGRGWFPARADTGGGSGVVSGSGFGHRLNLARDARHVDDRFKSAMTIRWEELVEAFEWIPYLTQQDLQRLLNRLETNHAFTVIRDPNFDCSYELNRVAP